MTFTDQMNRSVILPDFPPQRIVSLVPSQTEFLHDLGLENEVVGITKFCVHPPAWFREKTRVGGTKTLNFKRIEALNPDLIIGNKEENVREQIELLARQYPVWMSDVLTLEDALDMMERVGALTGKATEARVLASGIRQQFEDLAIGAAALADRPRVAYLIWRKPYMVAGANTFIHQMLEKAGFRNVFADLSRYPEIGADALAAAMPELILLSSEPYPFADKHLGEFREICPAAQVEIVDGELFSWYGSRLRRAPAYFQGLRETFGFGRI